MTKGTKTNGHTSTEGARSAAFRAICCILLAVSVARADTPRRPQVKGELTEVDGLHVLRVWGTPRERGFAEGYLAGEDGAKLLHGYLQGQGKPDAATAYEAASSLMLSKM